MSKLTCEHPDGCTLLKHKVEYVCQNGMVTFHYRKYCKPHSNRLYRSGNLGTVSIRHKAFNGDGNVTKSGYKELYKPNHPLAAKNGKVREHRMILFDAIGPGNHPCFWCHKDLNWKTTLTVDHIDFDKLNNRLDNLVPSCQSCNTKRFNALIRYILNNNLIDKEVFLCLG